MKGSAVRRLKCGETARGAEAMKYDDWTYDELKAELARRSDGVQDCTELVQAMINKGGEPGPDAPKT